MDSKVIQQSQQAASNSHSDESRDERLAQATNQWLTNGTVPSAYLDDVLGNQCTVITTRVAEVRST